MNLSKKIIKKINKCANDNCYTIYITSIESVIYITSQTPLANLRPKTSRDLLYLVFKMLQSQNYGDGKNDYFFNTKKNKIIPAYINDNTDTYRTQFIYPICFDDTIHGTVIINSNNKVDLKKISNDAETISINIVEYWISQLSLKFRKENYDNE